MDDKNEFLPIQVIGAVPHNGGIRFFAQGSQIDIGEEQADMVWKILEKCNGYQSPEQISKGSGLDVDLVKKALDDLSELGIIVDSREQYLHFHNVSSYPPTYYRNLSNE